jgi:hypothetical protein
MWRCVNCETEIENKYLHCWQCGTKHGPQPTKQQKSVEQIAVPKFASYEEIAKVPANAGWIWRRGPVMRIFWFLLVAGLLKVLASPFLGAYGTYIVLVFGVGALVVILWRYFRRDPTDGVGIKLH